MITLIPAIDLIEGKCVRLTKGDYSTKKVYNEDPVAVACELESCGIGRLHVVDLDGARQKRVVNHKVLERIATATDLVVDFGGGIKSDEDLHIVFESGAAMATIGSVAATSPELFMDWLAVYGAERMILGADVKNGVIAINGWEEESCEALFPFIERNMSAGVRHVLCTDISCDGMLGGPSLPLYRSIIERFPDCGLIASGGIGCMSDIMELEKAGIRAVVFGKAIYEGRITLDELTRWIANQ